MSLPIIIPKESETPQVFPAETDYTRFRNMLLKEQWIKSRPTFFELPSGPMQRYANIVVMTGSAFSDDVIGTCFCFDAVTGAFISVGAYD